LSGGASFVREEREGLGASPGSEKTRPGAPRASPLSRLTAAAASARAAARACSAEDGLAEGSMGECGWRAEKGVRGTRRDRASKRKTESELERAHFRPHSSFSVRAPGLSLRGTAERTRTSSLQMENHLLRHGEAMEAELKAAGEVSLGVSGEKRCPWRRERAPCCLGALGRPSLGAAGVGQAISYTPARTRPRTEPPALAGAPPMHTH